MIDTDLLYIVCEIVEKVVWGVGARVVGDRFEIVVDNRM